MLRIALCFVCSLIAIHAEAQIQVFANPPDPAQAAQVPDSPFVIAQYPVTVDICGIAKSLYPISHGTLVFALPSGATKAIQVKSASLQAGFDGGADQLCNDPNALRYYLYGTGYGSEMTLYVAQGRASGGLNGMLERVDQAWWINTLGAQHYLRDIDTSGFAYEPDELEFLFRDGFED